MLSPKRISTVLSLVLLVIVAFFLADRGVSQSAPAPVRTYYIAAEEVEWDYAPDKLNQITGQPFDETANVFVERKADRIGSTYRKAVYREYTDSSFRQRKSIPPEWQHLGLLGPVIRAEVGDSLKVVFRNNTSITTSIHPHGVFYKKDAEGALYNDGTDASQKADDAVPPGQTYTYTWTVPERAGPGPHDPNSIAWMYHGHTDEIKDTYSGLIGPMIISAKGTTTAKGTPKGIDREFVTLFTVSDENKSWYLDHNMATYTKLPKASQPGNKAEEVAGKDIKEDEDFTESNLMHSINGYLYGNMPMLTMGLNQRVRWYVITLGTEVDLHTPHWHGATGLAMGMRMDMLDLLPGDMKVWDMVADSPGTWLLHCHVNDHLEAGMAARFTVLPAGA